MSHFSHSILIVSLLWGKSHARRENNLNIFYSPSSTFSEILLKIAVDYSFLISIRFFLCFVSSSVNRRIQRTRIFFYFNSLNERGFFIRCFSNKVYIHCFIWRREKRSVELFLTLSESSVCVAWTTISFEIFFLSVFFSLRMKCGINKWRLQ